jgi:hypothetical protein
MEGCGEANERRKRNGAVCPLMAKVGGKNQSCHIPQLLPFLPPDFSCYDGDDCLICKISPEIVERVARHNFSDRNSKMSVEELEKAGKKLIEIVKMVNVEKTGITATKNTIVEKAVV